MKKYLNINGICYPEKHYMVNITNRLEEAKHLIDNKDYFVINRARQYGKTTTLWALQNYLKQEYLVILLDFQRLSSSDFQHEFAFVAAFCDLFVKAVQNKKRTMTGFNPLIIENLKKIASKQITSIGLRELLSYYKTEMNFTEIAEEIYRYTSGYPYLVSYICKILDEQLFLPNFSKKNQDKKTAWTKSDITQAVNIILKEPNMLFDDMIKKLEDYPELRTILKGILYEGKNYSYHSYHHAINIGSMFGFLKEKDGWIAVTNRIFETQLYNLFLSEEMTKSVSYQAGLQNRNQFIQNGYLNMDLVIKKFTEHFTEIYANSEESFLEENGRRFFLLYLKPIINGVGNYYIEAQTRDMHRTDVIIDYHGIQYIVEMKLWHGEEYNHRGEKQLVGYLKIII